MADGAVAITAGSGTPIRVLTALGAGSADQQVVTLADSAGNLLGTNALPLPIAPVQPTNAPRSSVAASTAAVPLLAANPNRRGAVIVNESSATLYVAYGSAGTVTDYTYRVDPSGTWVMDQPAYTGPLYGSWDSATGNARVTELTS